MKIYNFLLLNAYLLITNPAFAKSLDAAAKSFNDGIYKLGATACLAGAGIAAMYMAFGKQEGREKLGMAITGLFVILLAGSAYSWLKVKIG